MGKTVEFGGPQQCSYRLANHWDQPLDRIAEYIEPFELPPSYYVEFEGARLSSHRAIGFQGPFHLIDEMYPFHTLGLKTRLKLQVLNCLPRSQVIDGAVCSLVSPWGWHDLYFHWFLDYLPVLFAAEHYTATTGNPITVLVPPDLKEWQTTSLIRLGYDPNSLRTFAPSNKGYTWLKTGSLLASHNHRCHGPLGTRYDALSPRSVRELKKRLSTPSRTRPGSSGRKIFLSRSDAASRRLVNEAEILGILSAHGFELITLGGLSLDEQIKLFSEASHIVAVHGAGLTNLLHADRANVLEIHSRNHGIRPDYFQLASINHCNYFFYVAESHECDDVSVPPHVVHAFLEKTH